MKKVLVFIAITILLVSFLSFVTSREALRITASAVNNGSADDSEDEKVCCSITPVVLEPTSTYEWKDSKDCDNTGDNGEPLVGANNEIVNDDFCEDETEQCLDECPVGCASPENRICASNGEKYCNTCAIECYGLTEAEDSVCEDETEDEEECEAWTCTKWGACVNNARTRACSKVASCVSDDEKPKTSKSCIEKEKIEWNKKSTDCPFNCTCTGKVTKCLLADGTREMTVVAGKSGNTIIQVKGANGSTTVTLYKDEDGALYGVFKNNETKKIKMLPDQVQYKITERTAELFEDEEIELSEDGTYKYQARERVKLFAFIPVKLRVNAEIDPETGEIVKFRKSWWTFLTNRDQGLIAGNSCGTVSPTGRDVCCRSMGFDSYDADKAECVFNAG